MKIHQIKSMHFKSWKTMHQLNFLSIYSIDQVKQVEKWINQHLLIYLLSFLPFLWEYFRTTTTKNQLSTSPLGNFDFNFCVDLRRPQSWLKMNGSQILVRANSSRAGEPRRRVSGNSSSPTTSTSSAPKSRLTGFSTAINFNQLNN